MRNLRETLLRIVAVAMFLAAAWLLLHFYTETQLLEAARAFWVWWTTRLTGELGAYWNPVGAGIALAAIVLFVTQPIRRLFRRRHHYDSHYYESDSSSDGGGDAD